MGKDQDVLQAVKDRDIPLLQKLLIKGGKSGKTSKFINDSILILIKIHMPLKKTRVVTL